MEILANIFNKNGSGQVLYNEKGPITISGDTFTIDMYGDDLMVFKKQ